MKKALLFLVDGFEEIEALGTVDILRRGNVDVSTVSITGKKEVMGSHKIPVTADILFEEAGFDVDMLILPGGTTALNEHEGLKKQIKLFADARKNIAAICAAPMVLGGLGLLKGKRATAYPGFEQYLDGAVFVPEATVIDGNIITGRGPGLTFKFALTLLEILEGKKASDEVAAQLLLK
ncbi:DJ-1/PfpI family protein [Paludibacter sp. 221]|uniref:DJ-1 family glyoxalase III n=1 Tax=Paludibacter sp. 221 TaxID=2302939 RepID=UPI0013D15787|nr:DJ-1 family glyoxalase III [Paludibacter sp. 221]NDV47465.1 DJ-1/PfpI family protein [Paludibacter sp. 221]